MSHRQGEQHASAKPWLVALLVVVTTLAFLRGLSGEFVYDDRLTVERNPAVSDASQLAGSLVRPMWDFTGPENTAAVGYWRPLANVALALAYHVGGGQPFAFHVLSLALHIAATWAAFRFARRLCNDAVCAFFAALLFGLHPVHVEAVSWLSAINEPLCGLFVFLGLDAFLNWRERGSLGSPIAAGVWFALGLASKELAIAVLPLCVAIDVARRVSGRESAWIPRLFRAYLPFAVVIATWYCARAAVFASPWAGFDRTTTEFGVSALRLAQLRVELLGNGIGLLVWPAPLRVFHPFTPATSWSTFGPALLVCVAWFALVALAWKKRSFAFLASVLIAPVALAPMIARVGALGVFPLAERYLYVAVLGATLAVSITAMRVLPRAGAAVLLAAIAVVLGWRTHDRTAIWSDEKRLLATAVLEAPRSPYVHRVLGKVLLEDHQRTGDRETLQAALASFQAALDLGSRAQNGDDTIFAVVDDFVQANVGLGWSLFFDAATEPRSLDEAKQVFELVLKHYPTSTEALTGLGATRTASGDLEGAKTALEKALSIDGRYVEAHNALGVVQMKRGDFAAAADSFEKALNYRPDHLDYLLKLAGAHESAGDDMAARQAVERARELAPDDPRPRVLFGIMLAKKGDLDGAMREFEAVLEIAPDDADAWMQKAKVLLARNETNGAKRALLRATECAPGSYEAHYNAGALILQTDGLSSAMPFLTRAYELRARGESGRKLREMLMPLPIQSADTLRNLATIDADRNDVTGALEWIERAL
ncbi:MAG: tetratricopeptide repeat protein, partial [Planctomycetota bacterium]|nr:tetratricopeptide repeat protein [Planctomycetota bacterium]